MNSNALPSTILHPEAFQRSPSAGFDGVTFWEWLANNVKHVRGITPTDVDAAVGVNHFNLIVETKDTGVPVTTGQRRFINDKLATGLYTAIYVWGKEIPTSWQWQTWTKESKVFTAPYGGATMLDDMGAFARLWIDKCDALPSNFWRLRMIDAALLGVSRGEAEYLMSKFRGLQ
jgi:hypothetical protein